MFSRRRANCRPEGDLTPRDLRRSRRRFSPLRGCQAIMRRRLPRLALPSNPGTYRRSISSKAPVARPVVFWKRDLPNPWKWIEQKPLEGCSRASADGRWFLLQLEMERTHRLADGCLTAAPWPTPSRPSCPRGRRCCGAVGQAGAISWLTGRCVSVRLPFLESH